MHGHSRQMPGPESGIDGIETHEAPDQQAGATEDAHGQCDLAHDEDAPRPARAKRRRGSGDRFLQRGVRVAAESLPRGRQAERDPRQDRYGDRETQHARVDVGVPAIGQPIQHGRGNRDQEPSHGPEREDDGHGAGRQREQERFDHELANDIELARSYRPAQANLARALKNAG